MMRILCPGLVRGVVLVDASGSCKDRAPIRSQIFLRIGDPAESRASG